MNLATGQRAAEKIAEALNPFCERIEIVGSIRRRRPEVNDVDLVLIPRDLEALKGRCRQTATAVTDGPQNMIWRLANGMQLDIFVARPDEQDLLEEKPSNFGVLQLIRTGSKEHNIWLIERAKSMGLTLRPQEGLFAGEALLASSREQDILAALDLEWIRPEDREK
jgi:DNA polymerase/3'-5' exonuclease PolX